MAQAKAKRKKEKKSESAIDRDRFSKIIKRRSQVSRGEHRGMKLMLVENVPALGRQGDIVEVKLGYGRNYLVPQGLATEVTPEAQIRIEKHKAKVEAIALAKLADLKRIAKQLQDVSITIEANANEEGHLYGSVTAADISRAIKKESYEIEEGKIRLEGPIKELGLYHVAVHLTEEVETEVKLWVVPISESEGTP